MDSTLWKTSIKIFEQLFADEKERRIELNKTLKETRKWGGLKQKTKIKKARFCSHVYKFCHSELVSESFIYYIKPSYKSPNILTEVKTQLLC